MLGRSFGPALPIPAVEGSDRALRAPARPLGWGGGWLRATSARGGCGSGSQLPTMVWRPGARRVPRPPWATAGGGRARHLGSPGQERTQGPGKGGRSRRPPTRPTCCAGGGWEPRERGAPPAAFPGPGGGAQGGVPFMGKGSWAPPRAISVRAVAPQETPGRGDSRRDGGWD